ncbi:IS110 family transposase [Saccharomonospora sp. NPDC046836]|uniref:IS110 family transposase n=1 Tax=Saccharomonospora sp. NPDC046836 TaxID=3156921 RepID=UPI0033C1BB32
MDVVDEPSLLFERVVALDIGKASLMACVRVPHPDRPGARLQEVREYLTLTPALVELADWLRCARVQVVGMEATSDYWKPVYYLLEAEGFTCWLLNAKHVKHAPGRAKTDRLDAMWLAKVVERGMCSPSLVHPPPVRHLRDMTRYRRSLVRDQTREKQRLEKVLEDAQIKLSSVVSDILGVSGRDMLDALIAGVRDPRVLAEKARGRMRPKIDVLVEALTGYFDDHHAFLARRMLDRIDTLAADITVLDQRIEAMIAPFARQVMQLDELPATNTIAARELIAEIGVDIGRFPTAAHLVSWAKFAPIDHTSAGKGKAGTTGKGNPWLAATLGEIVTGLSRTHTFLGERYRRIAKRRGTKRAIVAVGNSVLTIIWHLLSDPDARYHDLGEGFYASRINTTRRQRHLLHQLETLTGRKVTLQPAA